MRAEPPGPMGVICLGPPNREPIPAARRTRVGAVTVGERSSPRFLSVCDRVEAMSEPEKKPPKVSWESWIERKIRESMERGEFDNLPGHGQPIPDLARPYDELWWLRKKVRDEGLSIEPPAFTLRREL